jgi:hypothetical protein
MNLYFKAEAGGIDFKYWDGRAVSFFQNFFETQGTVTNSALTWAANNLAAYPVIIKADVTIEELRIAFNTSVAGNSVFGIYDMENGLPKNLVFQSTAFNNAVTGIQIYILPTPQVIKKGLYFVAHNSSSAPAIFSRNIDCVANVLGANNTIGTGQIVVSGGFAYTGTLPAVFPATVTNTIGTLVPNVLFKIS